MITSSGVFKLFIGAVMTLGIAAAGVVYFINYRPTEPSDFYLVTLQDTAFPLNNCSPVVQFFDRSVNEDDFRVYRRNSGATAFTPVLVVPPSPGKGKQVIVVDPSPLPWGVYEYRVSAYNAYGESFTAVKKVTVDWPDCKNLPAAAVTNAPLNPIIVSLSPVNDCYVHISFRDNSTNEQGLRIYRARETGNNGSVYYYEKEVLIATLGAHNGIPGTYDDKTGLVQGIYRYRMSAYNQAGERFGNFIEIAIDPICNPTMHLLPTKVPAPLIVSTPQKLSAESCTLEILTNVFLREGPDVALFDRAGDAQSGETFPVIGQSENGKFWAVEISPGVIGYITQSEKYGRAIGNCENVPTRTDPEPPPATPTPKKRGGGTVPACRDGVDNDGDGLSDYNDFGSGDPGCSSADDNSE